MPDFQIVCVWAYAALQNWIPSSFHWVVPPRPPPWRNPRKGRDQILPSGNLEGRAQFYVRPLQLQYEESWSRFRTEIVCCKIRANVACGIHTAAQEIGRVVSFDPVNMNCGEREEREAGREGLLRRLSMNALVFVHIRERRTNDRTP